MSKKPDSLEQDYRLYYFFLVSINPYEDGLDLNKTLASKDVLTLLAPYTDGGRIHFFPNPSLNIILSELILSRVVPHRTRDGRDISCVEDIKRLWLDAGLPARKDPTDMVELTYSVLQRCTAIKALLSPQIEKEHSCTQSQKRFSTKLRVILYISILLLFVILVVTDIGILVALVIDYLFFTLLNFLYSKEAAAIATLIALLGGLGWLIRKVKKIIEIFKK